MRVRRAGTGTGDAFPTQTLQVGFLELEPGGSNEGHGDQNEATLYILEGSGYEIHDGERHDWEKDDLVIVPVDSVHRHHNASATERARAIAFEARTSMALGLMRERRSGPFDDGERYESPRDWSALWTPGAHDKKVIVRKSDTKWENTRDGFVRVISAPERADIRTSGIDVYEQEIASKTARHWHMADEVVYVLSGSGESLQWDVEAEIGERYQARIAKEASPWKFGVGDLVYVPQNTVHQHVNTGREHLRVLVAQNRLFKLLGYDAVVYPDEEREAERARAARSRAPSR